MTELILYYISHSFILQRQKNLKWGKLKLVNVVVRSLLFNKSSLLSMLFLDHIFIHTLNTLTSFLPFLVFWNCGDTYLWCFLFFSTFFSKTTNIFSDGIITKATQGGDQFVSIDGKRTYFAVAPTHMPTFQHTRPCKLDILFPSNYNIHKNS